MTHLEGNVGRFGALYEHYNGGAGMATHWLKKKNATIFNPCHIHCQVPQNYRDEQRRVKKQAGRRATPR